MVAFLGSNGFDVMSIMDYEDGLTLSNLLSFNVETGRQLLVKEKSIVNGVAIALASIFDQKVLKKFNQSIDEALEATRDFTKDGSISSDTMAKGEARRAGPYGGHGSKVEAARHTMKELNKLNVLLIG